MILKKIFIFYELNFFVQAFVFIISPFNLVDIKKKIDLFLANLESSIRPLYIRKL